MNVHSSCEEPKKKKNEKITRFYMRPHYTVCVRIMAVGHASSEFSVCLLFEISEKNIIITYFIDVIVRLISSIKNVIFTTMKCQPFAVDKSRWWHTLSVDGNTNGISWVCDVVQRWSSSSSSCAKYTECIYVQQKFIALGRSYIW